MLAVVLRMLWTMLHSNLYLHNQYSVYTQALTPDHYAIFVQNMQCMVNLQQKQLRYTFGVTTEDHGLHPYAVFFLTEYIRYVAQIGSIVFTKKVYTYR